MLDDVLKQVAVLGAAGKMGSGISILLLQEMTRLEAEKTGKVTGKEYRLILVDANDRALANLKVYLRAQLRRYAEKNINSIRGYFTNDPSLISNEEIIDAFIEGGIDRIRLETDVTEAAKASLVFEAIVESIDVKAEVFSKIDSASLGNTYYFTNTSSIPIGVLDKKCELGGRIIGFHFYNPPPVQKLLEIIPADNTLPILKEYAQELAQRLGKITVYSKDVAGFIGNGHFMREIDYACRKVKQLESQYSRKMSVWMINRMTHDFLIRPMGIFQLLDYVGLDVCQKVLGIMRTYLNIPFDMEVIDSYINNGLKGGQNSDGSQKDGIFSYGKKGIEKIWDDGQYVDLPEDDLGHPPQGYVPWKQLHKDKNKNTVLCTYFKNLFTSNGPAETLAQEHLFKSREIAGQLVSDGVAQTIEDVNTVLKNGFYHIYGADNEWIPEDEKARSGS